MDEAELERQRGVNYWLQQALAAQTQAAQATHQALLFANNALALANSPRPAEQPPIYPSRN